MLAIIIPYFKITFFEQTLMSLAAQTCKDFKVYIGDDASAENPNNLLKKYSGKFDFIYQRFETNLGSKSLVKQWERCIALSKNEKWIMVLGDDDELGENVVEAFYENLKEIEHNKSNVIRFATQLKYEGLNEISAIYNHPVIETATDSYYRKFRNWSRSSLSEHIFSSLSYKKYGFYQYPLAWNSDDRAWLDFSDNKPIYTINEAIVSVRVSDLNISGKQDNILLKNQSTKSFFRFIVTNKFGFYNRQQRYFLLKRYRKEIKQAVNFPIFDWFIFLTFCIVNLDGILLKKRIYKNSTQ